MALVPPPHEVRASDAERERVATALRDHAGDGRLDPEELDRRLDLAYAARTRGDLVPLLADLPAEDERPRRDQQPGPLPPFVFVSLVLLAIWAMTGAGYFWPMWPIGAMLLAAIASRADHHHKSGQQRSQSS
jgi:hypothetical protein